MKPFTESMRYEYPLTKDSVVVDCGAHRGTWSAEILRKYPGCRLIAFEPIRMFANETSRRLWGIPNVDVFSLGVGGANARAEFHVQGDSTGKFAGSTEIESVEIVDLLQFLERLQIQMVDLIKINIEGGEFELLESFLERGDASMFTDIQVQFHPVVANYQERWEKIRAGLLKTHELTYDAPWCWENYHAK